MEEMEVCILFDGLDGLEAIEYFYGRGVGEQPTEQMVCRFVADALAELVDQYYNEEYNDCEDSDGDYL